MENKLKEVDQKEVCFCPSYFGDDNLLHDCTCGKCKDLISLAPRKVEIIDKDIVHPRLTVTKDRITMKFPLKMSTYTKNKLKDKFLKVADKIGYPEHSLRSSILVEKFLAMRTDKGKVLFRINLEEI